PPHQPPCPPQPQDAEGSLLFQRVLDTRSALARRVEGLEHDKAAQQLEIVNLKARVKKLERINKVKSSKLRRLKKVGTSQRVESSNDVENVFNQGRIIVDMDQDEGIELVADQEKDAKKDDEVEGRHADEHVEIYNIDFNHSSKVLSMQENDTEVQEAVEVITTAKLMTEAAKRRKLHEQAKEDEDLKKQLEVVVDEDDDVFIEATPIGRKVPVVDYEIVMINNKPRIMKDRFSTSKPTNFSDDYLLSTLKTMFEKIDGQDAIWRNQQIVYGQALVKSWMLLTSCGVHIISLTTTTFILLVEKRYPLSKFTLEQLVNVARLQVEEDSEMSLELLRFTRQQLHEFQQG
nr:hypothetical protein [Tanacetum cinerariifolium]